MMGDICNKKSVPFGPLMLQLITLKEESIVALQSGLTARWEYIDERTGPVQWKKRVISMG